MSNFSALCTAGLLGSLLAGCGSDGDGSSSKQDREEVQVKVISRYVEQAEFQYSAAVTAAEDLRDAIDGLVESPSEATLEAARNAWLAAREPYGQTEVYRFYDGPIDNPEDGPEGQINAWPLDEAYVDYVEGDATAGIINKPAMFPTLSKELIAEQNEKGAEENISSGYHAIEFLLWGQDRSDTGPGARPHTDYLANGTATNQQRRGEYLGLVAELLVDDLQSVSEQWTPGGDNYSTEL